MMVHILLMGLVALFAMDATHAVGPLVVPGLAGSVLEARVNKDAVRSPLCRKKRDWFKLWLNPVELTPGLLECWVDNAKLVYDVERNQYFNSHGVETKTEDFGGITGLVSPQVARFFQKLAKRGNLEIGVTLRGAPYDFRYGPDQSLNGHWVRNMVGLVEETYKNAGNERVTILSHSLGCPYSLYFLNHVPQEWKDQYVRQWLPTSGVFGGSGEGLLALLSGDPNGIPGINTLTIREQQRSWESSAMIAPTTYAYKDAVLVMTPDRNYTAYDYDALFKAAKFENGFVKVKAAHALTETMIHPGVEVFHMYGTGVKTGRSYTYATGNFDQQPTITYGDGDGTVGIESLELPLNTWDSSSSGFQFRNRQFPGQTHIGILEDDEYVNAVIDLLH